MGLDWAMPFTWTPPSSLTITPDGTFLFLKLLGSSRIDHTSKVRSLDCLSLDISWFFFSSCLCSSCAQMAPSQVGSTFLIEFEDVFKEHRIFSHAISGVHQVSSVHYYARLSLPSII
jgi:hypothetical protein